MTTITEDFWDQDELTVPSPFSPLESFPDSDSTSNSEYEVEEESLFSSEAQQEAQEQFAYALESALTEALAKYSVTHTKTQNTESATNISTIGEFWNGCVDDIEIDEEISSLEDEICTIAAEIETFKGQNHLIADAKTFLSAPIIIPSTSIGTKTQDIKRASADLSLPVRIISSDGPIPPPPLKSVEVVELKETKTRKKTKTKQPKPTKSKKRKADEKEILIDESPVTKKLNNSKQNSRKKSSLRSSTALKEVFKLEQVLKIKTVDQDSENEEVDIGDSTDCVCI